MIALFALLTATAAPAQSTGLYRIAGKVISSADGRPLANASISIRLQDSSAPLTRTATSSDDGRFEFTGLPAGNFTLQGEGPSFLLTFYDDHDGFTTGIITGSTVPTDSLILKLVPKCTLSGAITNDFGEPAANAQARLFRQSHSFGDGRIVPAATESTDDLGRFEFPSLAPADYLIAVTAQPWYAIHPQPPPVTQVPTIPANTPPAQLEYIRRALSQMQRQAVFGVTGPLDSALDVAYPITYYPHGSDPTDAQPIPLRPGDSREISLQLSAVPAVTITIPRDTEPVPDPANGTFAIQSRPLPVPQLRTSIFGQLEPVGLQGLNQTQNAIILSGLAPGDYILANGNTPLNQPGGSPIHLSSSNNTINTTLPDPATLAHVHITLETVSGSPPANVPVGLIRAGTKDLISRFSAPKGDTVLDVPPGDYSFTVQTTISGAPSARSGHPWFLRGITANGKTLPANSIHLAAGDSPTFTLTVIPGDHTLRGFVVQATNAGAQQPALSLSKGLDSETWDQQSQMKSTPAPGVFLLLIPTDQLKTEPRRFWRQQSDLDGSFSISGLAPGSYTLFAIDEGWTLDWQQPGALDHYLPAATQITIPDTAPPIFALSHPIPAQPK